MMSGVQKVGEDGLGDAADGESNPNKKGCTIWNNTMYESCILKGAGFEQGQTTAMI